MLRYILRATLTLGKVSASPSSCSKIACWDGVTHYLSLAKAANWIISSANTLLSLKSLGKALASFSTSVFISALDLSIYIPWPFPPVWGVADNTKETTKTIGVSLHSSSNDEGSS